MDQQLLISREEAAGALGISLSHFQRHVQPELPCVRSGCLRLYRRLDLEDWIDRKTIGSGTGQEPTIGALEEAHHQFIAACEAGVALNKRGRLYKRKAVTNLDSSLNCLPDSIRRKSFGEVVGADLQMAVDDYRRRGLSASRIKSIICAVCSLYTWGIQRGMASQSPAKNIRLPVIRCRERDRIATPAEFARLLDALKPADALPWALAAYGTARLQEIQILGWEEVDFDHDTILLAAEDRARKSDAAHRLVPLVVPLRRRLLAEWVQRRRPRRGRVCPPRQRSRSGLISLNALSKRVAQLWQAAGLEPIGLQDSRHTAATWLDHASVSPKLASALMGHATLRQSARFGASPITLQRYTHVLDGELYRARDLFDGFLAEREAEEATSRAAF